MARPIGFACEHPVIATSREAVRMLDENCIVFFKMN